MKAEELKPTALSPEEQELYEDHIESLRLAKSILEQKYDDGKIEGKIEMIKQMLKNGIDISTICKGMELDETEIKKLIKEHGNN